MNQLRPTSRGRRLALSRLGLAVLTALTLPAPLVAQDRPTDARRPLATRAELQAALGEAEQVANGGGYSASFRSAKRDEAAMIRERLSEGDFYVGDQITITVVGADTSLGGLGGAHTVNYGRVLTLPTLGEIPLRGVLRSEIQAYLTEQLGRYVRNPDIRVRPSMRLTIRGGVNNPGFQQVDADMLLADALTLAGGINNSTVLKDSKVLRGEDEIVDGETFAKAVTAGLTVDQLNLRAGDEIEVGVQSTRDWFTTLRTFAAIPALILSTYGLGKLFGIF